MCNLTRTKGNTLLCKGDTLLYGKNNRQCCPISTDDTLLYKNDTLLCKQAEKCVVLPVQSMSFYANVTLAM